MGAISFNPASGRNGAVQSAIAQASAKTGIDFNYLLGQAQVESGLNASARAGTSSATGLYQFLDQSWLAVVKRHGAEHGLGWAADSIQPGAGGRLTVSDPATRQAILDLRKDPQTASLMAAEHAADNKVAIEASVGREATGTDLYMAHFLGLGGARNFLKTLDANPGQAGAALFPAAAAANRNVFYGANGQPRSLAEIYSRFAAKLDRGAALAGGVAGLATTSVAAIESEVIPGNGETMPAATRWAQATLDQINGTASRMETILRPSPDSARIAYLMLASLGG